jgi:hypothetical protein
MKTKEYLIMLTLEQYLNPNRARTKAELAHPGIAGCMFYDPERPVDSFDEIRRIQRQRTFDQMARSARMERERAIAAGEIEPQAAPAPVKAKRVQPTIAATAVVPVAVHNDAPESQMPMHMVGVGGMLPVHAEA